MPEVLVSPGGIPVPDWMYLLNQALLCEARTRPSSKNESPQLTISKPQDARRLVAEPVLGQTRCGGR